MKVIEARNAQQMLPELLYQMKRIGVRRESRNGPVLRIPGPCTLVYRQPRERVVFWPERDANPFFHLLEAMWMLAGRNDVAFPASIVKSMEQFSDNGTTFHGAYGYRWRRHFGFDQIYAIAKALRENPDDRRQVLAMWDAGSDLEQESRDLPCNTHAYFSRNADGRLEMMVCNRSNDSVWGAVGANVVHFSVLQEVMAGMIGCGVGTYWQVSNNMHLYLDRHAGLMEEMAAVATRSEWPTFGDPYTSGEVKPTPLFYGEEADSFLGDVGLFLDDGVVINMKTQFIRRVLVPFTKAVRILKSGEGRQKYSSARIAIDSMSDGLDWKRAAIEWINRREAKYDDAHRPADS